MLKIKEDEKYLKAKRKVQNLRSFYRHLIVYISVNIFLFMINLVSDPGSWWFIYPLGGWGIGILIHGFSTFTDKNFGVDWEERKIKEYMEKDNKK